MPALPREFHGPAAGNAARINLATGPAGEVRACVVCAVYLVTEGERHAASCSARDSRRWVKPATMVEIAAQTSDFAARIAAVLRRPAVEHNIYRRQVVSFTHDMFGERAAALSSQPRPTMAAELILPEATPPRSPDRSSESAPAASCRSASQSGAPSLRAAGGRQRPTRCGT
jgi:hypothetical protein